MDALPGTGPGGGDVVMCCCEFIFVADDRFRGERARCPCLRTNSRQSQNQGPRDKKRQHGGRGRKDRKTLRKRRNLLQVMGLEQWARMVGG